MRNIAKIGLVLFVVATLVAISSCERRPLEDEYFDAMRIPVGAVWTKADIAPQNVTVLFYNQVNGNLILEHRYQNNDKRIQTYVNLPVGIYTAVLFNEIRDQIDYVGTRRYENLHTLEAYATPATKITARANGDEYVSEPDVFASVMVEDFEVTADVVNEALVGIVPERKTCLVDITIHVKGLNNARMPALVDLRNMSRSYLVGSDLNSTELVAQQFTMNNRTYDAGSNGNGTIHASLRSFGVVGNRFNVLDQPPGSPILLDIMFMLVDAEKTMVNRVIDVTNLIRFSSENNGSIVLNLDLDLGDALPDVVLEGSNGGSGFETKLIDWDVIEVPLIAK